MKSILITTMTTPFAVETRELALPPIDRETFNICATIFVVALFMMFILSIIKRILEYRLKNRIIEKGIPEDVASSVLQVNPKEDRNSNVKWFAILTGVGAGLTLINYTLPLGFHSMAILSFCIAASFLGYFFFVRSSEQ